MKEFSKYVGLDVHKETIAVAVAEAKGGEVRYLGDIANTPEAIDKLVRQLRKNGATLSFCYEAGPCGYGLHRQLTDLGWDCQVVASSLIPKKAGDRVKTDRRDSLMLARLHRAGELTAVWVPDAAHEAIRDLTRAQEASVADLLRCRQRIAGFLLRQDIRYAGTPWTKKHRAWLGRLDFAAAAHRLMFAELLDALDQAAARRDRLSDHIAELVPSWSLAWLVDALQALRGYRLTNAARLAAEIGDPRRFDSPRQLMAYLGMVPSEHSTGARTRRGGLTRTGNGRARKTLIEAAWTYARPARTPAADQQPAALRAIADKARHRLNGRYRRLLARGKRPQVAVAAVARESLGFIWAIAHAAAPHR